MTHNLNDLRTAASVLRRQRHAEAVALDIANAERDAPIRELFHALLVTKGFHKHTTPAPGAGYPGSHVQTLWEFFLVATLAERERCAASCERIAKDADNPSVAYGCADSIRSHA